MVLNRIINQKNNTKRLGFTLIEIIVVLAIIGLLASISIVSYGNWRQKTNTAQVKNDLSNLASAFENYRTFNNAFPTSMSSLTNFKPTPGINITGGSTNGSYFCINAIYESDNTTSYYISSLTKEIKAGICPPHSWKAVSMGGYHTCAIASNDEVYCWGSNSSGQLGNNSTVTNYKPVPIAKGAMPTLKVKSLSTGSEHACVVNFDDHAYCWGNGYWGQLGTVSNPMVNSTPVAVTQGVMSSLNVKSIAAGDSHTCALGFDDIAYCWGYNNYGQIGDNSNTQRNTPVAVAQGVRTGMTVKYVTAGYGKSCAIDLSDIGYCWGYGSSGSLGNGLTANTTSPVAISQGAMPSLGLKSIKLPRIQDSAISSFACAINLNNRAYCWGQGFTLGNGVGSDSYVPVAVSLGIMSTLNVTDITLTNSSTCALNENKRVYCWGGGSSGQLGNGKLDSATTPVLISIGEMKNLDVKYLDASCVINSGDDLYCFGSNSGGKLGKGFNDTFNTPMLVSQGQQPFNNTQSLSPGYQYSCSIGSNSKAYCWGYNNFNQLGDGTVISRASPTELSLGAMPANDVKSIKTGNRNTCAIASNDRAYCWGENSTAGKLGDGTTTSRSVPVAVSQGAMPSLTVSSISVSTYHTCAINSTDNRVYCWGSNSSGQLGDGTTTNRLTPVAVLQGVMPSLTVKALSLGLNYSCAINDDDRVYCWGSNSNGVLGNNSFTSSSTPVALLQGVMPSLGVKKISTGSSFACVINITNSGVYCWGNNQDRQIVNNATSSIMTPTAISQGAMPSLIVKDISLGSTTACSINDSDLSAYCWGGNGLGQIGDGSFNNSSTPLKVNMGQRSDYQVKSVSNSGGHSCVISLDDKAYCWGWNNYNQLGVYERSIIYGSEPRLALPPI